MDKNRHASILIRNLLGLYWGLIRRPKIFQRCKHYMTAVSIFQSWDKTKVRHHWMPHFPHCMLIFERFLGNVMIPSSVADPAFSVCNQEKSAPWVGVVTGMPCSTLPIWQPIGIEFWILHYEGKLTKVTLLISD